MRKKAEKIVAIALMILTIVGTLGFFYFNPTSINLSLHNEAEFVFIYGDKNIREKVSVEDTQILKDIFHGKHKLFWDNPSCGFNTNVSVRFGNHIFSPACDNCETVKYRNKYFYLSDKEMRQVRRIMRKYGAYFPCV